MKKTVEKLTYEKEIISSDKTPRLIYLNLNNNSNHSKQITIKQLKEVRKIRNQIKSQYQISNNKSINKTNCGSPPLEIVYAALGVLLIILIGLIFLSIYYPFIGLSIFAALILTYIILTLS